ncbi:MAG: DUF2795 domain-containing protein [Armatimonadota bacterium]
MDAHEAVREILRGLNFPAGKGQIYEWVLQKQAPDWLVDAVSKLPAVSYGNLFDLLYDLRAFLSAQSQELSGNTQPQDEPLSEDSLPQIQV